MMWLDYFLYLYNLEESKRAKEVLIVFGVLLLLILIAFALDCFKEKHLDKIQNKKLKNFIKKL